MKNFRSELLNFLKDNHRTTIKEICRELRCSSQQITASLYFIRASGYDIQVARKEGTILFNGIDPKGSIPQILAVLEQMEMTRDEIKALHNKITATKGTSFAYILENLKQIAEIDQRWVMVDGKTVMIFSVKHSEPEPPQISKQREQEIKAEYERTKPARMPHGKCDHRMMRDSVLAMNNMERYRLLQN